MFCHIIFHPFSNQQGKIHMTYICIAFLAIKYSNFIYNLFKISGTQVHDYFKQHGQFKNENNYLEEEP